jgi:hypothetical protein
MASPIRPIVKLYRLTACNWSNFQYKEIANTPASIKEQLSKYDAVECECEYFAVPTPKTSEDTDEDIEGDIDEDVVVVTAQYKTTVVGICGDGCKAKFCLLLVEMAAEMPHFELHH